MEFGILDVNLSNGQLEDALHATMRTPQLPKCTPSEALVGDGLSGPSNTRSTEGGAARPGAAGGAFLELGNCPG